MLRWGFPLRQIRRLQTEWTLGRPAEPDPQTADTASGHAIETHGFATLIPSADPGDLAVLVAMGVSDGKGPLWLFGSVHGMVDQATGLVPGN
jgi:hypothetical protein